MATPAEDQVRSIGAMNLGPADQPGLLRRRTSDGVFARA
jgi:hypothetical protein